MTASIKALLLLAAMLLGAWLGYSWRDNEADAQLLRIQYAHEKATTKAVQQALARAHRIQEASDAEQIRRVAAEAALRRADAAGRGLRDELQATAAWARSLDSTLASERQAAAQAVSVLTDLLGRCDSRRRELAEFADRASSAGQTCVDAWPAAIKEPGQ